MYVTGGIVIALIFSTVVLLLAVKVYRRQQMLDQKRAEYLSFKKMNTAHWKRFETCQVEIDRIKADGKVKSREISLLIVEMDRKRREIREILEILKDESDHMDGAMDRDLLRIADRRKQILKAHWKELNGRKTAFLLKAQELQQCLGAVDGIIQRKDQEYAKWNETKLQLERLKQEFEQLSRSSVLSFLRH
jgi:hypothetical protein